MTDIFLVKSKLQDLQKYYESLAGILTSSISEVMSDELKLHSVERLFQLMVDTSVDINSHIIATADIPAPDDYQSTFVVLGEQKILPMDFALRIAPSVGLRNLVVHRYGKVDVQKMLADMKREMTQYREFAAHIDAFLKTLG